MEPEELFSSCDLYSKWINFRIEEGNRTTDDCIGFVLEENKETQSLLVWTLAEEIDNSKAKFPWDFALSKDTKKKPVWVRRLLDVGKLGSLEIAGDQSEHDISRFIDDPSLIIRAAGDRNVSYGDGGSSSLIYPIWYCNQPKIDDTLRTELLQSLLHLNEKRKDFQEVTPVEDIIDPDLGPLRIPSDFISRKRAEIERRKANAKDDYGIGRELREFNRDVPYIKLSESVKIRESYHWTPSIFHIGCNGSVKIKSRIHNLPPKLSNAKIYNQIAKVFEGMIPMFKNLNVIKNDSDTELQVIVKAQSYRLLPGMTYAGRWHVEGQTENIVAVGVYYLQVDEGLDGGKLKFRPADSPQPWYEIKTDCELEVKEGSAVVFSNMIPHRFRKIVNPTSEEKRRTFLNFFIVDPSQPLKTTKEIPSTSILVKSLTAMAAKHNISLPKPIVKHILSYMPNVWLGATDAKKFRKSARESMTSEKSGWGWINWGNCGTVEFVPSYSTWPSRKQDECKELRHTDSDNPSAATDW